MIRVPTSSSYTMLQERLADTQYAYQKKQLEVSTGKLYTNRSEDPSTGSEVSLIERQREDVKQFQENVVEAKVGLLQLLRIRKLLNFYSMQQSLSLRQIMALMIMSTDRISVKNWIFFLKDYLPSVNLNLAAYIFIVEVNQTVRHFLQQEMLQGA